jgi:indolepyruvate ferredoxin oxidoreductase, beta subunit
MTSSVKQQIIVSGVGGQGVLFVTRLLAEAAMIRNLPVFTSETHGMAQRGGTVLSHLKVGDFSSPLIRPAQADGLLVLKLENVAQHGAFLKSGGWAVVNGKNDNGRATQIPFDRVDADTLAQKIGNPKAVNLIVLGFALAKSKGTAANHDRIFCSLLEIETVLKNSFGRKKEMLDLSLKALEAGYRAFGP